MKKYGRNRPCISRTNTASQAVFWRGYANDCVCVGRAPGKITGDGYCKPRKRLLPDIITSPKQLDAIVRLANKLYRQFEARGHCVRLSNASDQFRRRDVNPRPPTKQQLYYDALWHPERPTVVYIDSVAIGLSLFELCEYVEMQ